MSVSKMRAIGLAAGGMLLASAAAAQQAATPVGASVLQRVPAGCAGFLVVRKVEDFTGKIDAFIKQISPPDQPLLPGSVLEMIKAQLQVGEGFDAGGGLAVVLLDPQQYDVDLLKLMRLEPPADPSAKPPELPLVLVIPGRGAAGMLAAYNPTRKGEHIELAGAGFLRWAREIDGYVLLGPNRKAIDAVAAGKNSVVARLSVADKADVARNDLTVWLDFRVLGPILDAAIAEMEKKTASQGSGEDESGAPRVQLNFPGMSLRGSLGNYRRIIKQMDSLSLGVRMAKTGIVLAGRVGMRPDSVLGKTFAAYRHIPGPLLDRLPEMPYVAVFGSRNEPKAPKEFQLRQMDLALGQPPFKDLPADTKAKLREVFLGAEEQVQGMQMYIGANTSGQGQLAAAFVLECKSAAKVKGMLQTAVAAGAEAIRASKQEEIKQLVLQYHKGLEVLGERKVDVISVDHPELQSMDEEDRSTMKAVIGEDKVRLLVAEADGRTLVITFGGGRKFLSRALEAAAGGGKLESKPDVAESLAMLPKRRIAVGLLSASNLMTLAKNIATAVGEEAPPLQVAPTPPFAVAVTVERTDMGLVAYLPTATIKEIVRAMQGLFMGMGAPPGAIQPMPGP